MSQYVVLILLPAFLISMYAQYKVKSNFERYGRVRSAHGYTGQEVAGRLLRSEGINNVKIAAVPGKLSDHYDPVHKRVNLSEMVYAQNSIAAVSVAAHECGHAVQDNVGYMPLRFRAALFPVANIGSTLAWPMILLGIFLGHTGGMFIQIGILLFMFAVLFQIVTLPVEYNASHRALVQLRDWSMLRQDEEAGARKVLNAAALTYLVAAISSILQLLRLLILFGGRRRRA